MDGGVPACLVKLLIRNGVRVDAEEDVLPERPYRMGQYIYATCEKASSSSPWKSVAS